MVHQREDDVRKREEGINNVRQAARRQYNGEVLLLSMDSSILLLPLRLVKCVAGSFQVCSSLVCSSLVGRHQSGMLWMVGSIAQWHQRSACEM